MSDAEKELEAREHTGIMLAVSALAGTIHPDWRILMATHPGKYYQLEQKKSGKEFWSIRGYSGKPSLENHAKDPDLIFLQNNRVKLMIEVKWGTVPGSSNTDLDLDAKELGKMVRLMAGPAVCRVRGPAFKAGRRYYSKQFRFEENYPTDDHAELILVSGFHWVKTFLPDVYVEFLNLARRMKRTFQAADIETLNGDDMPFLRKLLEAK